MTSEAVISYCEQFCGIVAPSGYEHAISYPISKMMLNFGFNTFIDRQGNLICNKNDGDSDYKMAFVVHMDSAPIIVNGIDDHGTMYWGSLSQWKSYKIDNQPITFVSGATAVARFNEEDNKLNRIEDISGTIKVGDFAALTPCFNRSDGVLTATFLDDRIGCAILVDIARRLKHSSIDLYLIFTVQEEVGNKGARKIAQRYDFDEVYVIDTTRAISPEDSRPIYVKLNQGTCLKVCDGSGLCSRELIEKVQHIANAFDIQIQKEVLFRGWSDVSAFAKHNYCCRFVGISIPCVNMHSRSEQAMVKDILLTEKLVFHILKEIGCDLYE